MPCSSARGFTLWRTFLCWPIFTWICVASMSVGRRQTSDLRIVALGDSITFGWWSNDLNGYRQDLAMMLQHEGYAVEYVGFVRSGQMINNNTEGFPGATIAQIHDYGFEIFNGTYPQPNVVLLHAGTNDANYAIQNFRDHGTQYTVQDVATQMINDLQTLLDDLFNRAPSSLVVLAQIMSDADPDVQDIIDMYNGYIPYLADNYPKHVVGVSMANIDVTGPDHDSVFPDDPTHPGNKGFEKMAGNFFLGILAADDQGLISSAGAINPGPIIPVGPSATNPSTAYAQECDYYPTWSGSPEHIFDGPSLSPGSKPNWGSLISLSGAGGGKALAASQYFYMADVNNDGLDEYLIVDGYIGTTHGWRTTDGGTTWQDMGNIASGSFDFEGATIKFADMNADGYADYIVHNSSGVYLLYNYYGNGFILNQAIAAGFSGAIDSTYFADVNGDGRADLIWVDSGNINVWINIGKGTGVDWDKSLGPIATGATGGTAERFFDVDGDGRADWVHVNPDSSMRVALNPDLVGYGAPPKFGAAFDFAPATGPTPANVTLGDVNGDGRADIITVDYNSGQVSTLSNTGMPSSGRLVFADGDNDGYADAWLIDNLGSIKAWRNHNLTFEPQSQGFTGTGAPSKNVHLADLNADGHADVIVVSSSPGHCTINVFPGNGNFQFGGQTTVWNGPPPQGCASCSQIQFYDNDGDGRDDLICVTPDATAWLTYNYNSDPHSLTGISWQYFGWVLINQNVGRNLARFVDLNGDGQGDVMTLDGSGGIHAFISNTASAVFGGINTFDDSHGIAPYKAVLADVDGDSRADYLVIDPFSGSVDYYRNNCFGKSNAKEGYPRKRYLARPGSPGTSVSTGPTAPTLTASNGGKAVAGPTFTATTSATYAPAQSSAAPGYEASVLSSWPIKNGYTAFGDSYAAGMGTGTTTGDSCRIGENNVGDLIYQWSQNSHIDYQRLMCSGDTTQDVRTKQLPKWMRPSNADVVTITIGGNDLGFSKIVTNCIITPWISSTPKNCQNAINDANDLLNDAGPDGMQSRLAGVYQAILDKGNQNMHLYVNSYIGFFNHDTTYCNDVTFYFWQAGHFPDHLDENTGVIYLYQDKRRMFNDMVAALNNAITSAINDINGRGAYAGRIHYVDLQASFDGHRWCEEGVEEPNENDPDTAFFLSAWKDNNGVNSPPGAIATAQDTDTFEQQQVQDIINSGQISLPDPNTCANSTDGVTGIDPWQYWSCNIAQDIANNRSGLWYDNYQRATSELQPGGTVNAADIAWYVPTREIKTFHPRTNGMLIIRRELTRAIDIYQGQAQGAQASPSAAPAPTPTPTGSCSPVSDQGGLCSGNQDQMTELRDTIQANINAGHGDVVYYTNVNNTNPIACTRRSSSAIVSLCAYWTTSTNGDTMSEALVAINSLIAQGCTECGQWNNGTGEILAVDYGAAPCNMHNGVTVCTCDALSDGHCIVT